MGLNNAQLKKRAEERLTEYLTTHGTKINESLIIWNKEPICVKDICVLSAVIENGVVVFCDYNLETRSYNKSFSRTLEDLDHHNINSIIDDLVEYDTWQERKSKNRK